MPIRPPKALAPKDSLTRSSSLSGQSPSSPLEDPLSASLDHEVLAEKAATYGRLVQRLEKTLAALREFEANSFPLTPRSPEGSPGSPPPGGRPNGRASMASRASRGLERSGNAEYDSLLDAAGEALWYVMIQRDLCGFRRHDLFYRELDIPPCVRFRMGMARSR